MVTNCKIWLCFPRFYIFVNYFLNIVSTTTVMMLQRVHYLTSIDTIRYSPALSWCSTTIIVIHPLYLVSTSHYAHIFHPLIVVTPLKCLLYLVSTSHYAHTFHPLIVVIPLKCFRERVKTPSPKACTMTMSLFQIKLIAYSISFTGSIKLKSLESQENKFTIVCTISFERPVNYLCDAWHVFPPKYEAWTHFNN